MACTANRSASLGRSNITYAQSENTSWRLAAASWPSQQLLEMFMEPSLLAVNFRLRNLNGFCANSNSLARSSVSSAFFWKDERANAVNPSNFEEQDALPARRAVVTRVRHRDNLRPSGPVANLPSAIRERNVGQSRRLTRSSAHPTLVS